MEVVFVVVEELRFLMPCPSEASTVATLKQHIASNHRDSFPGRPLLEPDRMRLRLTGADFYLADSLTLEVVAGLVVHGRMAEVVVEVESPSVPLPPPVSPVVVEAATQASESVVVGCNVDTQTSCPSLTTSSCQTINQKPVPIQPDQLFKAVMKSPQSTPVLIAEEESSTPSPLATVGDFSSRSSCSILLSAEAWEFRDQRARQAIIAKFNQWVSEEGDVWSIKWKRDAVIGAVALTEEMAQVVVKAVEEMRLNFEPPDMGLLDLVKAVRGGGGEAECGRVLRVLEVVMERAESRTFVVRQSPGLVNFLGGCLGKEGLEMRAAMCIKKGALEYEFRVKLKRNCDIIRYLAESGSSEARRLILLALENLTSCVEHNIVVVYLL